jgi:hypothetical protein
VNLIYFAHSYREEDAAIVRFFGKLMEAFDFHPQIDPPSHWVDETKQERVVSVNAAKLQRNMNSSDGTVAVLTRREGGVSPHIMFEIALCLRTRKPIIVFLEDVLPDSIVPDRVLQRRFSRTSYPREIRQHRHALEIFQAYLGVNPPPRYQPSVSQRSCLLVGSFALDDESSKAIGEFCVSREYKPIDLDGFRSSASFDEEIREAFAGASLSIAIVGPGSGKSDYLLGFSAAACVPSIWLTTNPNFEFQDAVPREYQPRIIALEGECKLRDVLHRELQIFEQDFQGLDNQEQIERYVNFLIRMESSPRKFRGQTQDQLFYQEVIMGDVYKTGQAGAVGPGSHAHDINFNQIWQESGAIKDLPALSAELGVLREALIKEAKQTEAKNNNGPKMLEYLSKAGTWAFDIASKIGVQIAATAIKESMKIP